MVIYLLGRTRHISVICDKINVTRIARGIIGTLHFTSFIFIRFSLFYSPSCFSHMCLASILCVRLGVDFHDNSRMLVLRCKVSMYALHIPCQKTRKVFVYRYLIHVKSLGGRFRIWSLIQCSYASLLLIFHFSHI